MRSNSSVDSAVSHYRSCAPSRVARDARDTGVEFLSRYRQLVADIDRWCQPSGTSITQMIRRQALHDYLEVYCDTYPRQPSYPFPPRFDRYAVYLDGFDEIVAAIDRWCEWFHQFLPGVMPIDLIRSVIDAPARQAAELPYNHSLHAGFGLLSAKLGEPI